MSDHTATINWSAGDAGFGPDGYDRDHEWRFEGGTVVRASSAPGYSGNAALVDPEEAFVAALASCHMLTFLALAAKKRLVVTAYEDRAVGTLGRADGGAMAMTRVVLKPRVTFDTGAPDAEALAALHDRAHQHCFIANSVTTDVSIEPR